MCKVMNLVGQSGVSSKQGSNKDVVTSKDDKYVYLLYIIKVQLLINWARATIGHLSFCYLLLTKHR